MAQHDASTNDAGARANVVSRRHPRYAELYEHWKFLQDTYRGGRAWFKNNVHKYHKEGDDEYRKRVERAYRFNHTREVVDLVDKYLFRSDIVRLEDPKPPLERFWANANGQGLGITEFMRTVSNKSSQVGRCWVVVDSKLPAQDAPISVADAEKLGTPIYAYMVSVEDALDMAWGEDGELLWILLREITRADEDPFASSGQLLFRYRLWTRNEWYEFTEVETQFASYDRPKITPVNPDETPTTTPAEKRDSPAIKVDQTDYGWHGLGRVPVVPVNAQVTADRWHCPALIEDIAYLDRAVANYCSNLDAVIQDQTFSQLTIPAQNLMPGESGYDKLVEVGTKRVFAYDAEGGGEGPKYISPDVKQAELIIGTIKEIINEIYHSVGLAGERTKSDNAQGIDNSSGVAKAHDFERVTALLHSKANALEVAENQIADLVLLWAGEKAASEPAEPLVNYPESFDVTGLFDEFTIAMQLSLIQVPAPVRARHMKRLIRKLFRNASKSEIEKLDKEIESWTEDLQETADLGNQAARAEARAKEEAGRDRNLSGERQSATKTRETGSD